MPRRICQALDLKDDEGLIAQYEHWHRPENAWPEVTASMRQAGVLDMEIYRVGSRLFMIMEVTDEFDPTTKALVDSRSARVKEWEALMWTFQQALPGSRSAEKWRPMSKIYALSDVLAVAKDSEAKDTEV